MELLAGLHPLFIHFPIVLTFIILYFEVAEYLKRLPQSFNSNSFIFLVFLLVFSVLSVITGNQALHIANSHSLNTEIRNVIEKHETFSTIFLWLTVFLFFYKFLLITKKKNKDFYTLPLIIFNISMVVIVILTAFFGGKLVYNFGIGTDIFIR